MSTADAPELFKPASERAPRGYRTPAAVLVLGALSIALLLWTSLVSEQQAIQDLMLDDAIRKLEVAVATSHLWLEELLTGDTSVDSEAEIWQNLDRSVELVGQVLDGSVEPEGRALRPLRDPRLRQQAEDLRTRIIELRKASRERYRRGDSAGIGTEMDQSFDEIFRDLLRDSEALRSGLAERTARFQARSRLRLWLVVGVWLLIVAAAVAGLASREKRRRKAEGIVRTSQRWLLTTLSSIDSAVVTTDLEGAVFFMNPMAEKLTGWPLEEASGQPIEEVFRSEREDGHPVENPVTRALRTGESVGMTNHFAMADRQREKCYGIDERAALIRDHKGKLLGAVLVFRDVSQRRQIKRVLRQREAELRQAQKMEAVGRLAGGIAHDINNYLGAIMGFCEVARMNSRGDEALAQRMDAAMETASEASALIRQLLAFSRKQPIRPEVVDLNRVVARMEGMMKQLLGDNIALSTDCDEGLSSVEVDPSQVEQILVNLLVNSRDAMPQGGEILVRTSNVEKGPEKGGSHPALAPGRYAVISVLDTGLGIAPEIQEKIFEPFFTTKSESGSSGLGLATVYGIVKQNGGFIAVSSQPERGTTFEIFLPACDRPATQRQAPAGAEAPVSTGPAKVLLVEDNGHMRASTESLLKALGHDVLVASDGDTALRLLAEEQPALDLLITDVVMPGLSGPQLLSRIREERDDLRCLFISGYTDNVILRHGLDQERSDFLQKPFTARSISRKIGELLSA